jgi:hypothetical protein
MSFVDLYLPYFRQQLITCLLSALLPFQPLFTESLQVEIRSLPLPLSPVRLQHPIPSAACSFSVPCLFFSFFFFCFLQGRGQSV